MHRSSISQYEEGQLIARCLRGEKTAWDTMFECYHPQLVLVIRAMLHGEGALEQAEEIAAAVWSSLCIGSYARLRRYDPRVGRLIGYLGGLARREIGKGRRSRRTRYSRECLAATCTTRDPTPSITTAM